MKPASPKKARSLYYYSEQKKTSLPGDASLWPGLSQPLSVTVRSRCSRYAPATARATLLDAWTLGRWDADNCVADVGASCFISARPFYLFNSATPHVHDTSSSQVHPQCPQCAFGSSSHHNPTTSIRCCFTLFLEPLLAIATALPSFLL